MKSKINIIAKKFNLSISVNVIPNIIIKVVRYREIKKVLFSIKNLPCLQLTIIKEQITIEMLKIRKWVYKLFYSNIFIVNC